MAKIDNFTVMKVMAERNMKLKLFPMQNFRRADLVENGKYGVVQFNVEAQTVIEMAAGASYAGGLILADKTEFDALKAELEAAAE